MDAPRSCEASGMPSESSERNKWLLQDDQSILAACRQETFVASGNGGQKRNHTNTAVRLIHTPSGVVVTDCETRSQQRNREIALRKLRLTIAMTIRGPELPQPDCHMSINNPRYPILVAWLMDLLIKNNLDPKLVAEISGQSRTGLLKLLARDSQLWQHFSELRARAGLPTLRSP